MTRRILILSACLVLASVYLAKAERTEPVTVRRALAQFPVAFDGWHGRELPLDPRVLQTLGTSDHLSRYYSNASGSVGMYIGFYETQRQGSTIHSPLNCLPGAGWNPLSRSNLTVQIPTNSGKRDIEINRIVIQKGLDRQVVLYWYQAHGRVVASEYWGKIYTVVDAIRLARTDAAMVRVVTPVNGQDAIAEREAERVAVQFVQSSFPLLSSHLPE